MGNDFEEIYEKYFKDVYRFIFSLCRNEHIAEEITQETFFKALKNIDKYNENGISYSLIFCHSSALKNDGNYIEDIYIYENKEDFFETIGCGE